METLKNLYPIARIEIFSGDNFEFHTYVFLETNDQVTKSEFDGSRERIEEEIYQQLEKVGRGSRPEVKIRFEYDSEENVKENFQGSPHRETKLSSISSSMRARISDSPMIRIIPPAFSRWKSITSGNDSRGPIIPLNQTAHSTN